MRPGTHSSRWRTLDIVVVAVLAVAFGVIFWGWAAVWAATEPVFAGFPPAQALLYGVWLLPAVLAFLVVRKPGAAVLTEFLAAAISAVLGNKWGMTVLFQGFLQGLGAEIVFAAFFYRVYRLPVAVLAGAAAGIAATVFDLVVWYPTYAWGSFKLPYLVAGTISAAVIAGFGGYFLTRALAQTGVLDRFPSGRDRDLV
ncbi:ECF transporter S component [Longispora albida]|uniref:ECF transporter S component n=1 Tax=Longispora albida TaxID=203523 RepID=UPI00035D0F9B|nr:ECF transporter S component [Longispora albida]